MTENSIRKSLVAAARRLTALGLNRGSTGNLSHRWGKGFLVTPSGMPAEEMTPRDLVWVGLNGSRRGRWEPSTEWRFHQALYQNRPEFHAVVHTHSVFATALACLDRGLPPFHYMVAVAGGPDVRCAPYRLFGTAELSAAVVKAMTDRKACFMSHHGLIAAGAGLAEAMKIALEIETLAEVYLAALAAGRPRNLKRTEIARALEKFGRYGQKTLVRE